MMEHRDTPLPGHDPQPETALEEIARETRATSVRTWTVTAVAAAMLLAVMYVVTIHRADEDAARHSTGVTQSQPGASKDVVDGIPRPGGA